MKRIKFNAKKEGFILINIGETFIRDNNKLYIRIPYMKSNNDEYNALNLNNDQLCWVADDELVEPVDIDIIVKRGNL